MNEYIVTVKYPPKNSFDKGTEKFRVNAFNEKDAEIRVKRHSLFPIGGEPVKIRLAKYKKIKQ